MTVRRMAALIPASGMKLSDDLTFMDRDASLKLFENHNWMKHTLE